MIFHPAHSFRHTINAAHCSAEILMKPRTPFGSYGRAPFFRAEDDVVVEAMECRAHGQCVG